MNGLLQRLFPMVFAIFIASPACCCSLMEDHSQGKSTQCCGGGETDPGPDHDCSCIEAAPAAEWEQHKVTPHPSFELGTPSTAEITATEPLPSVPSSLRNGYSWYNSRSPSERLALLQSYLI